MAHRSSIPPSTKRRHSCQDEGRYLTAMRNAMTLFNSRDITAPTDEGLRSFGRMMRGRAARSESVQLDEKKFIDEGNDGGLLLFTLIGGRAV